MTAPVLVIPFQFNTTEIRAINKNGEAWFVASDIAITLGYRDAANLSRRLDEEERGTHIVSTPSGDQDMVIINEPGLFHAILKSRKPEAKVFRKWVTSEVLPTIRRTGKYELHAEPSISPAQQNQIQQAIAARFPNGKDRPYAWSRFNNHFQLGSYKQLPGSKTDDALVYIASMETTTAIQLPDSPTPSEKCAFEYLKGKRFALFFDENSRQGITIKEIPDDAFVTTPKKMIEYMPVSELPGLIAIAANRLAPQR